MKPEAPVTQTVFPAIPVFSSLLRTPSPLLLFFPPKRKMGSNQKERKMQTTNQTKAQ
jgi:hypothetical protein